MPHKAGFVNIIGNPNVGKSTLMNALVGEKLSIITYKAQTTRHRILGIVNGEDFQIVYSDTPGIVNTAYKLHEMMMRSVDEALVDADVILYIVDITDKTINEAIVADIKKSGIPTIVVINKIDLSDQKTLDEVVTKWNEMLPNALIIPASAKEKFNMEAIFNNILDKLPESPAFYEKDTLTDKTQRFFISEIIREKIFLNYEKEIPYSTEVAVESFKDEDRIVKIMAYIFVTRNTQKMIILGKDGSAIKKTGTAARLEMEEWLGKKVFLELRVKVKKDWRDDDNFLKQFGYSN